MAARRGERTTRIKSTGDVPHRPQLYLFDMDGTLVYDYLMQDRESGRLVPDPTNPYTEPRIIPGRREVLEALAQDRNIVGFGIATNQGGVACGFNTALECHERIAGTLREIDYFNGRPLTVQIAWDHPMATVEPWMTRAREVENFDRLRKPNGGMIVDAASLFHMPVSRTLYVGDRDTDRQAADDAGAPFMWADEFFEQDGWKEGTG